MTATPASNRTHLQSPRHDEQSAARYSINDEGLCDRCRKLDLTDLYTKSTLDYRGPEISMLGTLHEDCRLCRVFADSYNYKFSEAVSDAPNLCLMAGLPRHSSYELHDRFMVAARLSGSIMHVCVADSYSYLGDNALITLSREEPDDATDPGTDDWGRQPCHISWLIGCLRHCAEEHQGCRAVSAHQFDAPVYLIDCDHRRLCQASQDKTYTALSYVWGQEHPDDGAAELDYFTGLPALLPLTIENAITLTRQLGMRYLWVDRYCISRSEEDSTIKHDQLRTMDQIYGQAELTIVSLGDDPQAGLPGVDKTPRWVRPVEVIRGYTFRTTFRDPRRVILESTWNKRGWTYQEACLSRRRVYFTPEEAVFECNVDPKSEIEDHSSLPAPQSLQYLPLEKPFSPLFTMAADSLNRLDLLNHINRYCGRKLTYQSDMLNAFQGVIGKYERGPYAIQHYWGIPIYESSIPWVPLKLLEKKYDSKELMSGGSMSSKFAASLTWASSTMNISHRRRSGFPSWSWAGWEEARCNPVYESFHIGDVDIWIELGHQELRHVDSFSSAGAFNLSPSQISPYIYIECLAAPVQIRRRTLRDTDSGGGPNGSTLPYPLCAEFQKSDGLQVICAIDDPSYELEGETDCKAIILGEPATQNLVPIFIMVVKEKSGFYERIGSLSAPHNRYHKWWMEEAPGKWVTVDCPEVLKTILKKEKIRLG